MDHCRAPAMAAGEFLRPARKMGFFVRVAPSGGGAPRRGLHKRKQRIELEPSYRPPIFVISQAAAQGIERTAPCGWIKRVSRRNAAHETGHSVEVEKPLVG
jgi:hypothetical protein